jgi:hypothetical protein
MEMNMEVPETLAWTPSKDGLNEGKVRQAGSGSIPF